MSQPPTSDPTPPAGAPELVPVVAWEAGEGLWSALVRTTWQILTRPRRYLIPPTTPQGLRPVAYGVLLGVLGALAQAFWRRVFGWEGWPGSTEAVLLSPVITFIAVVGGAAFLHLGLRLTGGAPRGFAATLRVAAYLQAVNAWLLVPWIGPWLGAAWGLAIITTGLDAAQECGFWRAVFALVMGAVVSLAALAMLHQVATLIGLA